MSRYLHQRKAEKVLILKLYFMNANLNLSQLKADFEEIYFEAECIEKEYGFTPTLEKIFMHLEDSEIMLERGLLYSANTYINKAATLLYDFDFTEVCI